MEKKRKENITKRSHQQNVNKLNYVYREEKENSKCVMDYLRACVDVFIEKSSHTLYNY